MSDLIRRDAAIFRIEEDAKDYVPGDYDEHAATTSVKAVSSVNAIEIPKNATMGEVFITVYGYAPSQLRANVEWWNAPFKKGGEND